GVIYRTAVRCGRPAARAVPGRAGRPLLRGRGPRTTRSPDRRRGIAARYAPVRIARHPGGAMSVLSPGTLVVSCQAQPDSPFHRPAGMTLMARAAALGGAGGIRANGAADIAAIHVAVDLPILGIAKTGDPNGVYITPTFADAAPLVAAGAAIVGLDATS